jgi:hypothetical protein
MPPRFDHGLAAHVRVFNSDALLVEHAKATSVQRASAAFEPLRVLLVLGDLEQHRAPEHSIPTEALIELFVQGL